MSGVGCIPEKSQVSCVGYGCRMTTDTHSRHPSQLGFYVWFQRMLIKDNQVNFYTGLILNEKRKEHIFYDWRGVYPRNQTKFRNFIELLKHSKVLNIFYVKNNFWNRFCWKIFRLHEVFYQLKKNIKKYLGFQ